MASERLCSECGRRYPGHLITCSLGMSKRKEPRLYTQSELYAAVEVEREACAKIAETTFTPTEHGRWDTGYVNTGIGIAAAIRNQNQGEEGQNPSSVP